MLNIYPSINKCRCFPPTFYFFHLGIMAFFLSLANFYIYSCSLFTENTTFFVQQYHNHPEKEMRKLRIGEVADQFGVTPETIRNWEREGKLVSSRTLGNHRRFEQHQIDKLLGHDSYSKQTVIYSRVSSAEQKSDLKRQTEELNNYCNQIAEKNIAIIEDIGSGINYKKRGITKLIRWILQGKVKKIVISYKDRLLRFGNEILEQVCKYKGVVIEALYQRENKDYEKNLNEAISIWNTTTMKQH